MDPLKEQTLERAREQWREEKEEDEHRLEKDLAYMAPTQLVDRWLVLGRRQRERLSERKAIDERVEVLHEHRIIMDQEIRWLEECRYRLLKRADEIEALKP